MEGIITYLQSLGEMIRGIAQMVVNFFKGYIDIAKMLSFFTEKLPAFFTWMPDGVLTMFVLLLGVAVAYKILGREG